MTVLISSHILPEIEVTCDRVVIVNQGRVVAAGTPSALRTEFFGPGHYELELAGPLDQLPAVLTAVHPSLAHVEPIADRFPSASDTFATLRLAAAPDAPDLREALVNALARDSRFRLRAVARSRHTLEEVFLAATQPKAA
jgi:ABC-2 type transport system ATP-binding protein